MLLEIFPPSRVEDDGGTALPKTTLRDLPVLCHYPISWGTYGASLWMLCRGLLPGAHLPLGTAVGAFTLGYTLGLLALFAPGGVGVRELVLIGLLAPFLGSGGAVALSVASRILLTVLEAAAALATLPLRHRPQESQ